MKHKLARKRLVWYSLLLVWWHTNLLNAERLAEQSNSFSLANNEDPGPLSAVVDLLTKIHLTLQEMAPDKGLANYDKNSELETALKDLVNASKDLLYSTYELVDGLPVVGPILGPGKCRSSII